MFQLDALASWRQRQAISSTCHSYPLSHRHCDLDLNLVSSPDWLGLSMVTFIYKGSKVVVVKACRKFRVTFWHLLSFRYILCTFGPSLKNFQNCFYSSETVLQRLLTIVPECISKQPSVECTSILQMQYCALLLAPEETYSSHVCCLSEDLLRVAIGQSSLRHVSLLLEDFYCPHQVG